MRKGMSEMAVMTLAIEKFLSTTPKTPTKAEAAKALRACGIFDKNNKVKPIYRSIIVPKNLNIKGE